MTVGPVAMVAAVAVLLAGGFALGRATNSEDPAQTVTVTADTGTGGSDDGYTRIRTPADYDAADVISAFPPIIVRDSAILDQKKGSPGRALLEWWQAYQFDDVFAVEQLTSPETTDAIGKDTLRQLVQLPGPGLQGIEILDVSESGDTATVNTALLNFQPEERGGPIPTKPTNSVPETLIMQKQGGEWLFADTEFLTLKLRTLPE